MVFNTSTVYTYQGQAMEKQSLSQLQQHALCCRYQKLINILLASVILLLVCVQSYRDVYSAQMYDNFKRDNEELRTEIETLKEVS